MIGRRGRESEREGLQTQACIKTYSVCAGTGRHGETSLGKESVSRFRLHEFTHYPELEPLKHSAYTSRELGQGVIKECVSVGGLLIDPKLRSAGSAKSWRLRLLPET